MASSHAGTRLPIAVIEGSGRSPSARKNCSCPDSSFPKEKNRRRPADVSCKKSSYDFLRRHYPHQVKGRSGRFLSACRCKLPCFVRWRHVLDANHRAYYIAGGGECQGGRRGTRCSVRVGAKDGAAVSGMRRVNVTQHRTKLIITCVAGGFIRNTRMLPAHRFLTKAKENALCLSVQTLLPTAGFSCCFQSAFLSTDTL